MALQFLEVAMRSWIFILFAASMASPAWAQKPPKLSEQALRKAFENHLKDADSAKFRAIRYKAHESGGGWRMCGEVNAKNSYGGYVGFTPFMGMVILHIEPKPVYAISGIGEAASILCEREGL